MSELYPQKIIHLWNTTINSDDAVPKQCQENQYIISLVEIFPFEFSFAFVSAGMFPFVIAVVAVVGVIFFFLVFLNIGRLVAFWNGRAIHRMRVMKNHIDFYLMCPSLCTQKHTDYVHLFYSKDGKTETIQAERKKIDGKESHWIVPFFGRCSPLPTNLFVHSIVESLEMFYTPDKITL